MHNLKVLCGEDPLDDLVALPPVLPQRTMACAQAMLGIAVRNGAASMQVGVNTGCFAFAQLFTMGCLSQAAPLSRQT